MRWQNDTFWAGCCSTTGGPVVVVGSADPIVVVDDPLADTTVVVDDPGDDTTVVVDDDGPVGVVTGCATAGAAVMASARNVTMTPPTRSVRRMFAS